MNIADIRMDYMLAALDEETAGTDPIAFFSKWFKEAESARITEINAMTLATADAQNRPHARIVLLKGLDERGFVFFTNYDSAKGQHIAENPNVSLLFFWKELERQVRIDGRIEKVPGEESDIYFHSRPEGSRLGAWASPQSREIPHRNILELNYSKYEAEFSGVQIPRPAHWGGYIVIPERIEFWQGRSSRMHDRILFKRNGAAWHRSRLAP
ncbi:MAG: pyridoxamine 5'-phosphate oxidase [Chitinophagaceae bacterium]|nr:pyridoxamine 5'-phosphate oxidase [Chitinophagaceae bacterium]